MENFLQKLENHKKIVCCVSLCSILLVEFIYRVGIIGDSNFAVSFAEILVIILFAVLVASAIFALFTKKDEYLKIVGIGFVGYYFMNNILYLINSFSYMSSNNGFAVTTGVFWMLSLFVVLYVVISHLIALLFQTLNFLKKFNALLLMVNIFLSLMAFIFKTIYYAQMDMAWYSYLGIIITHMLLPIFLFIVLENFLNSKSDKNKEE